MREEQQTIGALKKVSLLLEAGTGPDTTDLTKEPIPFEFVYGTGSRGMSPLELRLADKKEGDILSFQVRQEDFSALFQHLPIPFLPESTDSFYLKVEIMRVSDADPREVIKAMAEAGSCGDHCCGH